MTILDALLKRTSSAITQPGPAMRRAIATAHTAAYYAALKERTGVLPKGLSKVERAELKRAVAEQLRYYDKFEADASGMSEQARLARAQKYVGAIKATYGMARHPGLPFYPTQGSECMTNCKCEWRPEGDTFLWVLHADEHCATCTSRGAGNPYSVEG